MATTYKVEDLSRTPSPDPGRMDDFKNAAEKLHDILRSKGIKHAFMGGFALRLLGNDRVPADMDLVVDAKISAVRAALQTHEGIVLPQSKLNDGVIRIFITIHGYDVHADIFERERGLGKHVALGDIQEVTSKHKKVPVLNYTQLIDSKLRAYAEREELKDAKDLYFLVTKAGGNFDKKALHKDRVAKFCEKRPSHMEQHKFEVVKAAIQ